MVEDMLNLVKTESERIDSRFLEPACGSGNFLKVVLIRKLETVQSKYGKSGFREYYNPQTAFGRGAPDFSWSTILIDLLDEVK